MKHKETFLKERYEKDELYFRVYDCYTPNYKAKSITSKFYSKYDAIDFSTADPEIVEDIKIAKDKGPKERYSWPVTENQCYGWFNKPLVDRHPMCHFPCKTSQIVQHALRLKADITMKEVKFTGIQFKLR